MEERAGPTESALRALWRRHRTPVRRLLSGAFLREWALRRRFDLRPLGDVELEISIGAAPSCPDCPNLCCGGWDNLVSLRLKDLALLIDLGRTELISRRKPRFPAALLAERPGLEALEASFSWRTLPVLRQTSPGGPCAALEGRRCGLHPHWPSSCARFPYALDSTRRKIQWGTRCPVQKARPDPEHGARLREATLAAYEARVMDAVLLFHARSELDRIGLGAWLVGPDEDPFLPPPRLQVLP